MGGNQSSSDEYDSVQAPVDYEAVITDALKHGWVLEHEEPSKFHILRPPLGFACRGWGAVFQPVSFRGNTALVPDYALQEETRHSGTRQ